MDISRFANALTNFRARNAEKQHRGGNICSHAVTSHSPAILARLPTEIIDQILTHLDHHHWHVIRRTHRLFQNSAQAAIFHHVKLYKFRETKGPSGAAQLIRLVESNESLGDYVQELTLGSLIDPSTSEQVKKLLPKVLALLKPSKVTLAFQMAGSVTRRTQEACMRILCEIFRKFPVHSLVIECDDPAAPIFGGLNKLPITDVLLTSLPDSLEHGAEWYTQEWIDSMAIPTLRCLDLCRWPAGSYMIEVLLKSLPSLTSLSVIVFRNIQSSALGRFLESKQHILRELSLQRPAACLKGNLDASLLDLSSFTALEKLDIDSSFLFGTASCSSPEQNGHIPEASKQAFAIRYRATKLLPPNLRHLSIRFNYPCDVFWHDSDASRSRFIKPSYIVHNAEYEWILQVIRDRCELRYIELKEEAHSCEDARYSNSVGPPTRPGWVVEFPLSAEMKNAFRELGCCVRVWEARERRVRGDIVFKDGTMCTLHYRR